MTIEQLYKKLEKEIKAGDGHNEVFVWAWGKRLESIPIKRFIHCSDAVVLEPKQKLSPMREYIGEIKEAFDAYYKKLKHNLSIR